MSTPIDQKQVVMEKGEASIDQKEVVIEKGEASTDQKEVAIEKGEASTDQKYNDWITKVDDMVEWLYDYCNTHFRPTLEEKIADMEYQIGMCIQALDSIPQEKRQSEYESAVFELTKGRLYNSIPGCYKEEAEHHLVNAVSGSRITWFQLAFGLLLTVNFIFQTTLAPYMLDAWVSLGICFAKKRDYPRAKHYYQFVLTVIEDSKVLRQLANLELLYARGECSPYVADNPSHHIDECIKYAQRALVLDDTDGSCLYTLGSAYFSSFLLDGGWNHDNILRTLEAYEKAEKTHEMKSNPELQYDCGIVNRFLENYNKSLIYLSDAAITDPSLDVLHQVKMTIQLLDKLEGLVQGKSNDMSKRKIKGKSKGKSNGKSKGKSTETTLSSLIQSLDTIDLNPSYNRATLDVLAEGPNKGLAVIGAVRCLVKYEYCTPIYYVLCDSNENSFVLTVFGIQKEAIKQGDQVTLLEPFCKFVDFEWKGKHYEFKSVRVNLVEQVLVNGNALSPSFAIRQPLRLYA